MRAQTSANSSLVVIKSMLAGNLTRSGAVMATRFPRMRGMWMNSQGEGIGRNRHLDQCRLAGGKRGLERGAQLLRVARAPAGGAEAFGIFDEIRIGEVGRDHPVAEQLLLDAAHIAEGAIGEYHRDQRNAVAHGGGELVAGIEEAAVAVDREHRHVRTRVLCAERRGVAPAEIVLIAGREKRTRLVNRHGEAGGEADLRDLSHRCRPPAIRRG